MRSSFPLPLFETAISRVNDRGFKRSDDTRSPFVILYPMQTFDSPFGRVSFTSERKRHIIAFHPDVAPYLQLIGKALTPPVHSVPSANDASVVVCYYLLTPRKVHLAVVVKTGTRPFVLTAYLVKKPKSRTM